MEDFFDRDKSQFQLNKQAGSWKENINYCSKIVDRVVNTRVHTNFKFYDGSDIKFMNEVESRRPFQQSIISMVLNQQENDFLPASDRSIIYIDDRLGNMGKSKIVKWFTHKFPNKVASFSANSDAQLRSAAIDAGERSLIFVDLPRATSQLKEYNDKLGNILAALEDIKNGCISSSFYGQYRNILYDSPHMIIFANTAPPNNLLSNDRWKLYTINHQFELIAQKNDLNESLKNRIKHLNLKN